MPGAGALVRLALLLSTSDTSSNQCAGGSASCAASPPAASRLVVGYKAFAHEVHDAVADKNGSPVLVMFFNGTADDGGDSTLLAAHEAWQEAARVLAYDQLNRGEPTEILRLDTAAAENAKLPAAVIAAPPRRFEIRWCYWETTPTSHHPFCVEWGGWAAVDADDPGDKGAEGADDTASRRERLRAVQIYKAVRAQVGMPFDILPSASALSLFERNSAACPATVLGFWPLHAGGESPEMRALERLAMQQSAVCFGWSADAATAQAFGVTTVPGMVKRWKLTSGEYAEILWKQGVDSGATLADEEHMAAFAFAQLPEL